MENAGESPEGVKTALVCKLWCAIGDAIRRINIPGVINVLLHHKCFSFYIFTSVRLSLQVQMRREYKENCATNWRKVRSNLLYFSSCSYDSWISAWVMFSRKNNDAKTFMIHYVLFLMRGWFVREGWKRETAEHFEHFSVSHILVLIFGNCVAFLNLLLHVPNEKLKNIILFTYI